MKANVVITEGQNEHRVGIPEDGHAVVEDESGKVRFFLDDIQLFPTVASIRIQSPNVDEDIDIEAPLERTVQVTDRAKLTMESIDL